MSTLLPDWLRRRAETHAARPALTSDAGRWTFAELDARVDDAARRLAGAGAMRGERIALLARSSAAFVTAAHAIGRVDAVLLPLNLRLAPAELARQLIDSGVRRLLHDAVSAGLAREVLDECARQRGATVEARLLDAHGLCNAVAQELPPREGIDLDAPHSIIYTSGTTGVAKGAVITWGNLWWSAVGGALTLSNERADVWLAAMPLFHVGGLSILTRSLIYGMSIVVHDGFDAARVNRAIDAEGITLLSVVAVMLQRLLDDRADRPFPAALRCVLTGGGPVPLELLKRARALGVPVALSYGLTETTSQIATLPPDADPAYFGSVGRPLLPAELRIERDGGAAEPGCVGEIVVRGPSVVRAYLNRPEATAEAWRGGWFHTGDLGQLDEDGYLYVLDRRDDLIVSGGENVYPAEIEGALEAHPRVLEAGVFGAEDARWGRVPAAIVRAGGSLDPDELRAFLERRLAHYKIPAAIYLIDVELPRTAAGKLQRYKLTALVAEKETRRLHPSASGRLSP